MCGGTVGFTMKTRPTVLTSSAHAPVITHGQIAARAFELWEAEGRPDGRDLSFWYEAERQLSLPLIPPGNIPLPTPVRRRSGEKARDVDGLGDKTEEMLENIGETDNYSPTSLGELTRPRH